MAKPASAPERGRFLRAGPAVLGLRAKKPILLNKQKSLGTEAENDTCCQRRLRCKRRLCRQAKKRIKGNDGLTAAQAHAIIVNVANAGRFAGSDNNLVAWLSW